MGKKFTKQIAMILVIILMLAQLSVLFPLFKILPFANSVDAAVLTPTQIASFGDQQWLIDEILRQVRYTHPTIANISGVTTEELAAITIINLDNITAAGAMPGQAGSIPPGISLLTGLTNLTVTNAKLTGNIPTEIGSLANLSVLDLRGNNLTGTIPSQIGSLTGLTYLNLSDNSLTGSIDASPIFSNSLSNLTYLSFANNQLTGGLPNPSTNMTNLHELNLSGNQLSGTIPANFSITRFPAIQNINISHNNLSGALTGRFTTANGILQYLDLSYNNFSGSVPDYSVNTAIIYLNLGHNNITSFDTSTLFKKTSIKYLYLNDNPLGSSGTTFQFGPGNSAKATTEVIDISNTGITSIGQIPADMQVTLREFYAAGNGLTTIPAGLTNCSNLEKLDLSNNAFTTAPAINSFTNLKYFNMSGNGITTLATNYFASNANLEEIYINNNNISSVLPTISHMTKLQIFNASNNRFYGAFPNLSTNTALRIFNIGNNKMSGTIPQTIETLTNLVELNISENEFVGTLSSWVKSLPSIKREGNFLAVTEGSQKTITAEVVYLTLLPGEVITLNLKADNEPGYTFSQSSIWDITESSESSSVATVTGGAGGVFTLTGITTGSAEFTIGLQGRDTYMNDNAQMILRINTLDLYGVMIRYVERGNSWNVLHEIIDEGVPQGLYTHYAPDDLDAFNVDGKWTRYGAAQRSVTLNGQYAVITVEYEKVSAPVNVVYKEQGTDELLYTVTPIPTAQVGSTYTYHPPTYYTKPGVEGEYRLVPGQNLSIITENSGNDIVVYYNKNLSYDQVIIRYIFVDPVTGIYEVDLVPLGYYSVGTTVYYRLPSTYMRNGLWKIERENLDIEHVVLQTGNTITVECTPIMTEYNQVIIQYVNEANTSQILHTVTPNPEPQQKGSIYVFPVPETLTLMGTYAGDWSVVTGTTQNVLIEDSIAIQYIKVLYKTGLTMYDVTINYVEQGNTGHLLQGTDGSGNPITNPVIVGQMQVGAQHNFTAPEIIDDNGILWQIVGNTTKTETIGATNHELIVEYEPILTTSHVLIKYVEDGNPSNVIETFNVGYKQVGISYEYNVPGTHINNGLWNLVGNSGARYYTILENVNEIMVYFTPAMANLEVNFVEDGNETNVINGPLQEQEQINTIYTYSAPSEYTDSSGKKWTLVPNTNRITIQNGNNVLNVKYTQKLATTDIQIRYIEKNNPANVLDTVNIGKLQIGTIYPHTAPGTINSNGLWIIDGLINRNYTITESSSIFTIEYTKVMAPIVIEYYDYANPSVILNTINVGTTYQVGTNYNYTVPGIYNSMWELESGGTYRTHTVIAGTNTIRVPYVQQITSTRNVIIKYVEKNDWFNVLYTKNEGTMNIGYTHNYSVDATYTDISDNGEWILDGNEINRTHVITADSYEIYVEYVKIMSTGNITINYVEQGNPSNILDSIIISNKQVGTDYIYSPDSMIDVNGQWIRVGNGDITHTVLASRKCNYSTIYKKSIKHKSNYQIYR